jgi:N-acetylglucosamine-6-phosphate deacetylase
MASFAGPVNATRQIGLEDRPGTLEPGAEANLTILGSDSSKADAERSV